MSPDEVEIDWIQVPPTEDNFPGRADACEKVCRQAAALNGWACVGIRHIDHKTTRVKVKGRFVLRPTDACITVYVGPTTPCRETTATGHGHFYVMYDSNGLPERLALPSEMQLAKNKVNPEIWDFNGRLQNTTAT